MRQRWSEYYEALLNVDDGRRAQLSEVVRVRVNDDANDELGVSVEDVRKAVKKLKQVKPIGFEAPRGGAYNNQKHLKLETPCS